MVEPTRSLALYRFPRLADASQALAEAVAAIAARAVEQSEFFTLALSGGSTPRYLYTLLGSRFKDAIPWDKTVVFWVDERVVPIDDPESNYRMAWDNLFDKVVIPASHIHRIPVEIEPPERAAEVYEQDLRQFFNAAGEEAGQTFDLILLGCGPEGHTASLFPGSPALDEKERWVRSVTAPAGESPRRRITLTLPAINGAERAYFLVSRQGKERIVDAVLGVPLAGEATYPAVRVRARVETAWFEAETD